MSGISNKDTQAESAEVKKFLADLEDKLRNCAAAPISDAELERILGTLGKQMSSEGAVNLDVTDIAAVTADAKVIYAGVGHGKGESKSEAAAQSALAASKCGASANVTGAIILVEGSESIELEEVEKAAAQIQKALPDDANVIFMAVFDDALNDEMRVTVLLAE